MHGVDADPDAIGVNQFPSVSEFSVAIGALGNIDGGTGIFTPRHAAGIGAVRGDDLTIGETLIGEKAFVTLDEGAADESRREAHADGYNRRIVRFPTQEKKDFPLIDSKRQARSVGQIRVASAIEWLILIVVS